jgi:hypothetical protein
MGTVPVAEAIEGAIDEAAETMIGVRRATDWRTSLAKGQARRCQK